MDLLPNFCFNFFYFWCTPGTHNANWLISMFILISCSVVFFVYFSLDNIPLSPPPPPMKCFPHWTFVYTPHLLNRLPLSTIRSLLPLLICSLFVLFCSFWVCRACLSSSGVVFYPTSFFNSGRGIELVTSSRWFPLSSYLLLYFSLSLSLSLQRRMINTELLLLLLQLLER